MSYNRTTWATGDVVTATKLNNIELGILANESSIENLPEATTTTAGLMSAEDKVELADLRSDLNDTAEQLYSFTEGTIAASASGWRLNESDGLCSSNSGYKIVKYTVTAGDFIKVVSDDRFQFQTVASVPSSGSSNRVGRTYGTGTYYLIVPETATYLIFSTPTSSAAKMYYATSNIDEITSDLSEAAESTSISGTVNIVNGYAAEIAPAPLTEISVTGTATSRDSSDVYLVHTGLNMIPYPHTYSGSRTISNVTFTENTDGTILVNGTASADINYPVLTGGIRTVFAGTEEKLTFVIIGCPAGGSLNTYYLSWDYVAINDIGNGNYFFQSPAWWNKNRSSFKIMIKSGTVCNNLLFKPMFYVSASSAYQYTYNDYVPYKGTHKLLTPTSGNEYVFSETLEAIMDEPNFVFVVSGSNGNGSSTGTLVSSASVKYFKNIKSIVDPLVTDVSALKSDIGGHYIDVSTLGWRLGTFADTTGLDLESSTRIITENCLFLPKGTKIETSDNYVCPHYWYESGFNNAVGQLWAQSLTLENDYYVRLIMKKSDNSAITDIDAVYSDLSIFVPNDSIKRIPTSDTRTMLKPFGINPMFFETHLMAHRGTSTAPENTMSAYKVAYENGLRMMECDIAFSSDDVPVLLHDTTIDRTSNGSGTCSDIPLATLETYDFGSWFSSDYAGEKIPTLAEFMMFCKTRNCVAELDLAEKNFDADHLAIIYDVVKECGMLPNTIFTVYNTAAASLLELSTDIILCIGGIRTQANAYTAINANYKCALLMLSIPAANFSNELALYITNLGCKARTWVINTAATAIEYFEDGCDYILTDSLKAADIIYD